MSTLTSTGRGGVAASVGDRSWSDPVEAAHRLVSVALLTLLPLIVVTADVLAGGPLRHLDGLLSGGSWHRADPQLVQVGYVLDRLGQRAVAGSVLVLVAVGLAWWRRSWRPLVVTGVAVLALNVVVGALKLGIGRSKPLSGVDLLYAGGSQYPSGHAANAVVSWGLLSYLVLVFGPTLWRAAVRALVALPVLVTVGMSTASLYLDYHWLTDLLAGIGLGVVILALVLAWDLRHRHGEPYRRDTEPAVESASGRVLAPARPPF